MSGNTDGKAPVKPPYLASDPELFARNLARAIEEGGRALAAFLKPRDSGESPATELAEQSQEVLRTIGRVGEYWASDPSRLIEAQTRLWGNYLSIWSGALRRASGEEPEHRIEPRAGDRRFGDPEWSENPIFDSLKQLYLATSRWMEELVDEAEGLDPATRHKARFYIDQINNALAPTNFALTNPEVLRETASTNAENLARGMRMLADDIEAGKGGLRIRHSDHTQFRVGHNLATTPGKVIDQNEICQIIQYQPTTEKVLKRPLLIVPPWINKFYVLDLTPEKSLIRWAIGQGHTVFVISWVNPDERHAGKSFDHYMDEGILHALDVIERATRERKVNAVGYCVGGTLLAIALAFAAAAGDDRIASATFLTTQIDFEHAGDLKVFADPERIDAVEARMRKAGYLEGGKMATAFNLLRSNELIWPYVVNNYLKGKEPFPFDLLYWNADATRMPAANHSFYLRSCYLENRLSRGEMEVGGRRLDLREVTIPIYSLATREDHIAPARSVFLGCRAFGGPVRFVLAGSGHIAGVVNPPDRRKYQYWTGGEPVGDYDEWLARAEEHPGSWWPDWQAWIEGLDDARVRRRRPGGGKLKPIEDAPGSYVQVRA
ncbi:class I poly(R)-hydroxyalkanoic acid synthase [Rhizobiales bacterium L72]|uniref:Class I poly(R)-hydroxyalkanoic acid synthase n=2 Tax=Propylenella binzhouense TaxID=2555902 RepID=A0A964WTZ0_9HYPH|nr:class I poly(R)-hydroxyalkanoic acid synthase [Propylenella binzhouense]MYZ48501.1 class I poly(R)-hydroxyalkanoic acid synthase [Propylenella binzhouense]